jgi:hypothetical protein
MPRSAVDHFAFFKKIFLVVVVGLLREGSTVV